jgi:hypothetical protein
MISTAFIFLKIAISMSSCMAPIIFDNQTGKQYAI